MIIDVEAIMWDSKRAWLVKGWHSDEDCIDAVRAFWPDHDNLTVGSPLRYRKWPGQWNVHIQLNTSTKLTGSFKARLVW